MNRAHDFGDQSALIRLLLCGVLAAVCLFSDAPAKPKLLSVFPSGGQIGTEVQIRVRGTSIEGAYAVWFDDQELSGTVESVDIEESAEAAASESQKSKKAPSYQAILTVRVADTVKVGVHQLRLVTPLGLSDGVVFRTHAEAAVTETEAKQVGTDSARTLPAHPIVVHGRISEKGQVDDYELNVDSGQELLFEVGSGTALIDPTLTLFEPTGSWLDPDRLTRLAYVDEPIHFPGYSAEPRMKYRFAKAGRYLLRVGTFLGPGSEDHVYQLRIADATDDDEKVHHRTRYRPALTAAPLWEERTFDREIGPDRMEVLWARSVKTAAEEPKADDSADGEADKDRSVFDGPIPVTQADSSEEPVEAAIPMLIEGAVERPGDIDRVKFHAKRGDRVVLEMETSDATVPDFNPFLKVVDEDGIEVFTNVHSNLNNNGGFIMKTVQPKTVFTFRRDGDFTLEIRDVTTQEADDRFTYRAILRPQVPHLGVVHIAEDYLNLSVGETTKVSITTDQEEGFDGYIALTAEGLPEGVQAIMGTEVLPEKPPPLDDGKIERYQPKSQMATMLFAALPDAPATRMPSKVRIMARPVREGKMGPAILAKEILLTVVRPPDVITSAGSPEQTTGRED